ncbi:hypothetical protein EYF80_019124 [Liparis tanakae]|uniref:Uncharacterized protein n=1 Tax=Liparis tanakae TaxID=230148 RepID=A0A4Z2HY94_9TELE|nr:hypothetical protein EYF80_019124 [Liparis tanakae]
MACLPAVQQLTTRGVCVSGLDDSHFARRIQVKLLEEEIVLTFTTLPSRLHKLHGHVGPRATGRGSNTTSGLFSIVSSKCGDARLSDTNSISSSSSSSIEPGVSKSGPSSSDRSSSPEISSTRKMSSSSVVKLSKCCLSRSASSSESLLFPRSAFSFSFSRSLSESLNSSTSSSSSIIQSESSGPLSVAFD